MMDEQTALVLALQLVALFSIAGALLLYLLCKIRAAPEPEVGVVTIGGGKSVLITSCDTALGLQVALHLGGRGFRVFAGLREGAGTGAESDSVSARVLRAWQKHREGGELSHSMPPPQGTIVALPLDVTREDVLHEAVDIVRAHLPAGEDGVWAVICTSGVTYKGRLEQQDIGHWDAMLKTNVVGLLRTARTFQGLLRNTKGRLLTLGTADTEGGSVACTATRHAVQGASDALRHELAPAGIKVITLQPKGVGVDIMFATPKTEKKQDTEVCLDMSSGCISYQPQVLSENALCELEMALTCREPKQNYTLAQQTTFWSKKLGMIKNI